MFKYTSTQSEKEERYPSLLIKGRSYYFIVDYESAARVFPLWIWLRRSSNKCSQRSRFFTYECRQSDRCFQYVGTTKTSLRLDWCDDRKLFVDRPTLFDALESDSQLLKDEYKIVQSILHKARGRSVINEGPAKHPVNSSTNGEDFLKALNSALEGQARGDCILASAFVHKQPGSYTC